VARFLNLVHWLPLLCTVAFAQKSQSIAWESFTIDVAKVRSLLAERGWVEVPERHSQANSPKIRLYLVRLAATTPKPGSPIIWLSGGPGIPGSQTLASPAWYSLFEDLRKHGDVIAFDQRGTGSSEPSLVVPGKLDLPSDKSVDSPEALQRLVAVGETVRRFTRDRGIDLAAYNTIESAQDVDAIRKALGVDKVVLFAHSYGTHLALATIKEHGPHIERAILGGVNGLDQRWRYPADSDAWLTNVAVKMRQDAKAANAIPDFKEQVKGVFTELDRDPIQIRQGNAVSLIGSRRYKSLSRFVVETFSLSKICRPYLPS
jgi:pimeloyl-ACP methyl ester carboxylesterase